MMMRINKCWENVDSLQDISKIIRTHYNYDLANIMDEFIEDAENEIKSLENLVEETNYELLNYRLYEND